MSAFILVSEVGPRDGLQSLGSVMPTADKKRWIRAQHAAGFREIEVGSFVPAALLPQLADTAEIVAWAKADLPDLTVAVLVPNLKGAEAAVAAGADKISLPVSVSETHSLRNVRRTHDQMVEAATAISALIREQPEGRRPHFEGSLSTAFGCTIEGAVPEAAVVRMAERLMAAGCDEVGLSDTSGYADPAYVRRLIRAVRAAVGDAALTGLHLHNTRGLGLANAMAGLEMGITTLDSSLGGVGGCPFAPGASGNIVTEDLVFMLEAIGYDTGVDLQALIALRRDVAASMPQEEFFGFLSEAGPPKGWRGF